MDLFLFFTMCPKSEICLLYNIETTVSSASEVTTVWCYRNSIIIIIIYREKHMLSEMNAFVCLFNSDLQ